MNPRVHVTVDWAGHRVCFRDLQHDDIPAIVSYWTSADEAFIRGMGADPCRLGTREALVSRVSETIFTKKSNQRRLGFAIELESRLIGYTNLNRYTPEHNVSHWHIVDPAWRDCGLSSALYPFRLKTYFGCTDIQRLTHQTSTRNIAMNRVLDRFVPVAETRYLDQADGLAAPGEFNIRHVYRVELPRILELATCKEITLGRPR